MNLSDWRFGAALLLFGALATGCVDRKIQADAEVTARMAADPRVPVTLGSPLVRTVQETLEINGDVVTSTESQVSSPVGGRLTGVYVKDGDSVSAGTPLASVDSEGLLQQASQARAALASARAQLAQVISNARLTPARSRAAVRQAEAQVRAAKAQLQKALVGSRAEERAQADANVRAAKSSLETAKLQLERVKTLVREGALAGSQQEAAENAYVTALSQYENALQARSLAQNFSRPEDITAAREQVRQAEQGLESAKANQRLDVVLQDQVSGAQAQVRSAQAQVALAEKQLRDATVRAPFSGRVYGRPAQPGVVVAPGTPILKIVSGAGIYFEGQVPSDQIAKVSPGMPVKINVEGIEAPLEGKVTSKSLVADTVGRLFDVRITFTQFDERVKPGMFARGQLVTNTIPNAVLVPESAVVAREGKRYVMTVIGDKAKAIPVTLGVRQGNLREVRGLPSGTRIVVKGQANLVTGSEVQIAK